METEVVQQETGPAVTELSVSRTAVACVVAAFVPGLGHAVLRKWDRASVFFTAITLMFFIGIGLNGRVFGPDFTDLFTVLKFIADAGSGLLYWIALIQGIGPGEPTAYTYDFGNVFIYAAGLLNMLVVVDAFDIARGRKP